MVIHDHIFLYVMYKSSLTLFQHIMEPTHYHPGETLNILNLVFINEQTIIKEVQYLPGLGYSDHVHLFIFEVYVL